ncbi:DUF192 domain-containing protein [Spirulina major]|uniref:DUF192 domain-containing protein n=1 Tax=Spirulina major TaxID=270636 RepID=UPI001C315F88|nr:DUF192 domain-containing protein [Spirulina major]
MMRVKHISHRWYWVIIVVIGFGLGSCATPTEPSTSDPSSRTESQVITDLSSSSQILPIEAIATVPSKNIELQLEVARTPAQQSLGLMNRELDSLPEDQGMLFPFDPPRPVTFWMKNVQINLDMIFLREGVVVAIAADVPPCTSDPCPTYGPPVVVDQVIEVRGGQSQKMGLAVGDRITLEFLQN